MNNIEDIFNKASEMLKKGHSKEEVLLNFSNHKEALAPLLDISLSLSSLPKNLAPRPAMQRKYALAPSENFLLAWLHISKFAAGSMSAMLLFSALAFTGLAAYNSNPGQVLFSIKKSAEQVPVLLAFNETGKASIQVSIAQQRLSEAQAIFNNPTSGIEQKKAALNELANQTSTAVAVVNDVTTNNPKSDQSHPLLNTLEDINSQQRKLLSQIKPDAQITQAAGNALESLDADSKKISAIKQTVAIADSSQALTKLTANPDSVAVLGNINDITNNKITVEKTTFTVNSETVISDSLGNTVKLSDIDPKAKVNIVGVTKENSLIAQQILITSAPEVKGVATGTPTSEEKNSTGTVTSIKKSLGGNTETGSSTGTSIQADPGKAVGGVIYDDPSPQFFGN